MPAASNTDGISYGDDIFPPPGPWHALFSIAPGSVGHPGSPPVSPLYPNVFIEVAGGGDGSPHGDIYGSFDLLLTGSPFGAYAAAFPPTPCGPPVSNVQAADDDGLPPFAFGVPNVGLGLVPGPDNVDSVEILDNAFVDFVPPAGDGLPDAPIFFSLDAASAGALPPLPPFLGPNGPADVFVWDPGTAALYNWAPAAVLGLAPGDDINALAVGYVSGAALPAGYAGAPDSVLLSLAPGSPSLGALPPICFAAGFATAGDVFGVGAFGGPPVPVLDAEMMGLNTLRSGGTGDDDLNAFDLVIAAFADGDGDALDDAVDLDDDNEGLGDLADIAAGCSPVVADTDGDGLDDYTEVIIHGSSCTSADTDGDGLLDFDEVMGMPSPKAALGILFSDPTLVDTDGDGCSDPEEMGAAVAFGGLRDPMNPFDFYDVASPAGIGPGFHDKTIDLFNDIFAVAGAFGDDADALPPGEPDGYLADLDRSPPPSGLNAWNMSGPDGLIDLFIDIFGVAGQFGHDCTASP